MGCYPETGQDFYQHLFESTPVESELRKHRRHHHNNQHVLLILEAADLFSDAGYDVLISPDPMEGNYGLYRADLRLVTPHSVVLFVEAERGGSKKHQDRREKWARCLQVTDGEINVVTASKSVMEAVKSEVIQQIHQPCRLRLTNINQARALQNLDTHRVWIEKHSD